LGARYDYRRLQVEDDEVLAVAAQTRSWNSFTGNVGLLFRVSDPVALVFNAGRGYRAPSSFELFANGVHEGTVRFERGDPSLHNETSLNGDLALRIQTGSVLVELGGFANQVNDFIYANPTADVDPESGFQIFDYTQGDALLTGFEASAEIHPSPRWHLRAGADFVRGQNTSLDQPLPFIPPFRLTYGVRWEGKDGTGFFRAPYFDVGGETNAKQSRIDPEDFAPAGYTLASFATGFRLGAGPNPLEVEVAVRNLLDAEYSSFMSRYKLYAPDPGRNVTFRLTYTF
jgi:iron complex outermembrane receptor protein